MKNYIIGWNYLIKIIKERIGIKNNGVRPMSYNRFVYTAPPLFKLCNSRSFTTFALPNYL